MRPCRPVEILFVATLAGLSGCTPSPSVDATETDEETSPSETRAFRSTHDTRRALALSAYWEPVPDDGVELGMGWDSREGRVVPNRCVKVSPVHSPGQSTLMTLDEVTGRSDVTSALQVSAAASAKSIIASGSASASFAKSTRVSSHSTTLLMKATVTNGVLFAGPADAAATARSAYPATGQGGGLHKPADDSGRLTFYPWAAALLEEPDRFRAHCGDGYVSAISSGARLLASFEISGDSAFERQITAAKVKGSYGPANFSGSVGSEDSNATESEKVSVRYLQIGGAKGAIATSKELLNQKLATLASEAFESPRFQDMQVTPYAQMAEVRFDPSWGDTGDEYDLIADTYWQLTELQEDLRFVLDDYTGFDRRTGLTEKQLGTLADDILDVRRAIFSALADPQGYFAQREFSAPMTPISLFPQSVDSNSPMATLSIDVDALSRSRNIGELARRLSAAFPRGNPSLLLLNLPLPGEPSTGDGNDGGTKSEDEDFRALFATAEDLLKNLPGGRRLLAQWKAELSPPAADANAADLRRAVVNRYLMPIVRRACERDPTHRDCLNRRELEELAALVPVRLE